MDFSILSFKKWQFAVIILPFIHSFIIFVARSCGFAVPSPVLSSSNTMLIQFHSDETETYSGFKAIFFFIDVAGKKNCYCVQYVCLSSAYICIVYFVHFSMLFIAANCFQIARFQWIINTFFILNQVIIYI